MVLVDPIFTCPGPRGYHRWSHVGSDILGPRGLAELHDVARRAGLSRSWFQDKPHHPHYDVTPAKRRAVIAAGAVEVPSEVYACRVSMPRRLADGRFWVSRGIREGLLIASWIKESDPETGAPFNLAMLGERLEKLHAEIERLSSLIDRFQQIIDRVTDPHG